MKTWQKRAIALAVMLAPLAVFASTDTSLSTMHLYITETKANGSNSIEFKAPNLSAGYVLTWPVDDGTSNQVLSTDGSGVLSWANAATVPSSGIVTSNGTSLSSTTTSAGISAQLSDESGSGALVFATSPALVTPDLGTPSAATLTNATGLPVGSGISGLGSGVATFLATPTSANLATALTNESGSGAAIFGTSPTLTTPTLSITDAATSATTDLATFDHASSGTPAAGFGDAILFNASSATVASRNQARIQSRWTTATDASRASALDFQTETGAGALTTQVTIAGNGNTSFAGEVVANGKIFTNTANDYSRTGGSFAQSLVLNTSTNFGGAALNTWSTTSSRRELLDFNRSDSNTIGTYTPVQSGDFLGTVAGRGVGTGTATDFLDAAAIEFIVDSGTISGTSMPGKITFNTTPSGSAAWSERGSVDNAGRWTLSSVDNNCGNICSGTFTPVLNAASNTNMASNPTFNASQFMRIGSTVNFSFRVDAVAPTSAGTTASFQITVPQTSNNFASAFQAQGTCGLIGGTGFATAPWVVEADPSSQRIRIFTSNATSIASNGLICHVTYRLV